MNSELLSTSNIVENPGRCVENDERPAEASIPRWRHDSAIALLAPRVNLSATIYAAKQMFGEPTRPLFCIVAFMSSELDQERAFVTSATSCRITSHCLQ